MLFKPDWEETKKQYIKWWNKEQTKPMLQLYTMKNKRKYDAYEWDGWDLIKDKDNPLKAITNYEKVTEDTLYLGETYPNLWLNLGPGVLAAYLTGFLGFNGHSAWFEHPMDWNEIDKCLDSFDTNSDWWQYTKKLAYLVCEHAKGKYLTGMTDLGGIADVLASLRSTETLLYDLVDSPNLVIESMDRIIEIWHQCYNALDGILSRYMEGSSAWMGLWCPQKWYPIQCDFSAMISPKMFEKFVEPYILKQTARLDHTIYHLDGPGEIPHLDILLDNERLDGIQWVPGAGDDPVDSDKWLDLYKRIQNKGKLLVLTDSIPAERVSAFFEKISPEGVVLAVWCKNEEEAYNLLEWRDKL